jgi:predicted DNA-binding transcriptional regulator AlpA
MQAGANSVPLFCKAHGISRATFYNLMKRGEGPIVMRVGRRTLVSDEAAAAWRRRMETLAAAHPVRGRARS